MACRTNRANMTCPTQQATCSREQAMAACHAVTLQYKPFTKTFYNKKLGWQTKIGSWTYPSWAVRYLPNARKRYCK